MNYTVLFLPFYNLHLQHFSSIQRTQIKIIQQTRDNYVYQRTLAGAQSPGSAKLTLCFECKDGRGPAGLRRAGTHSTGFPDNGPLMKQQFDFQSCLMIPFVQPTASPSPPLPHAHQAGEFKWAIIGGGTEGGGLTGGRVFR